MAKERETFGSRYAVIMAMAGSAIGLGNIWRFPYTVGQGGGALFILIYLLASLLVALPILLSETVIGRRAGCGTFGAMEKLAPGTRWKWLGLLTVFSPLIILSYYSVVGGWAVDYLMKALTLQFNTAPSGEIASMFARFTGSTWAPLACHTAFLGMTALIVVAGVKKGIERFASITMPVLFLLMLVIMGCSLSLPGAGAGVSYLLKPDFSKIGFRVIADAMGQAFFSLSLGVGTILTYASYVHKNENMLTSGLGTAGFDLLFALIAGFAIMPAVFSAGIEPSAGPGLVFETLPFIFSQMGIQAPWLGAGVAILFFFTILVAALTSSISMLEVGVAWLTEEKGMGRGKATLLLFGVTWALGCLCSLSFGPLKDFHLAGLTIFECCDKLTSNFLMSFGGLLFTLFAGWKMKRADVWDELTGGGRFRLGTACFGLIYFLIRYVAPLVIVVIFLSNLF